MSDEKHPREETQEDREQSYRNLNNLIKRKVIRHRRHISYGDQKKGYFDETTETATCQSDSGQRMSLHVTRGKNKDGSNFIGTSVSVLHDEDVFGRKTNYISVDNGPFLRDDLDGKALEMPTNEELEKKSPEARDVMARLSIVTLSGLKELDRAAGIDGFPISAAEANELFRDIENSTFDE